MCFMDHVYVKLFFCGLHLDFCPVESVSLTPYQLVAKFHTYLLCILCFVVISTRGDEGAQV